MKKINKQRYLALGLGGKTKMKCKAVCKGIIKAVKPYLLQLLEDNYIDTWLLKASLGHLLVTRPLIMVMMSTPFANITE